LLPDFGQVEFVNSHSSIILRYNNFEMKKATLKFSTILELIDFQSLLGYDHHQVDRTHLTISGQFEHADIELAKAGFKAIVIEENED
jgi:hypothetical protein